MREWLARDDVADGIRRTVMRGDVLRAELARDGDAMLRIRFRGSEAARVLAVFADASSLLDLFDRHASTLGNVALRIEGGDAVDLVEDAVGGTSGIPFGVSTSDRK